MAADRAPHRCRFPDAADRRPGRAAHGSARRDGRRRTGEGRRGQPGLELARHDQPDRASRGLGTRPRRDHGRRRGAGRATPADRRSVARRRLRRLLVAQDVRPDRGRRPLGPARAARGDVPVQLRRLDDPLGQGRGDALERAAVQVRGGDAGDRRGLRARCGDRLPRGGRARGDRAARARARGVRPRATRRAALRDRLRAAGRPARRARLVQRRRRPPARRGAGARLGGNRDPRRPPLLPAADDPPGRGRDEPGELLPVHDSRGDRPAGRGPAQGERCSGEASRGER